MVRFLVGSLVILLVTALVFLMFGGPGRNDHSGWNKLILREAVVGQLQSIEEFELESIVVGTEIEDHRFDFRGMVSMMSATLPLYGVVLLDCDDVSRDPECWSLDLLLIDGSPWPGTPGMGLDVSEISSVPLSAATESDEETPPVLDDPDQEATADPAADEQAVDVLSQDAVSAGEDLTDSLASRTVYRVTANVVNGRAGPGTNHPVLEQIVPDQKLILLEQDEQWGRFAFLDAGQNESAEFWISLSLVTEAPAQP